MSGAAGILLTWTEPAEEVLVEVHRRDPSDGTAWRLLTVERHGRYVDQYALEDRERYCYRHRQYQPRSGWSDPVCLRYRVRGAPDE